MTTRRSFDVELAKCARMYSDGRRSLSGPSEGGWGLGGGSEERVTETGSRGRVSPPHRDYDVVSSHGGEDGVLGRYLSPRIYVGGGSEV